MRRNVIRNVIHTNIILALRLELVRAYQTAGDYLLVIMCL